MKVKDLIRDTMWFPGTGYEESVPEISILLPTFRRGADGLLRKVIQSILFQSFDSLELIIIDDASTDGSAVIIREAMAADPRVSCLTHPRNVGLPAVSEYEAYVRARGNFIGFAFDDFLFEEDAFQRLYEAAQGHPGAALHGYINWYTVSGDKHTLGQTPVSYDPLNLTNFIGNSSVLLPREIIEEVGLYDPHIALSRVCDWDLWRRIHRKFPIVGVPVLVGDELGASRSDSLGATYPMHSEVLQEFMAEDRDALLRPANFGERDVAALPHSASVALYSHLVATGEFFSRKPWFKACPDNLPPARRINIGVYGKYDVSVALMFDGLPDGIKANLTFIDPPIWFGDSTALLLSRCDAVIIVRHIYHERYEPGVSFCRRHHIPMYWLIDDNFSLLSHEYDELKNYQPERLRVNLLDFQAVLVSSAPLFEYASTHWHEDVRRFGAICDPKTAKKLSRLAPSKASRKPFRIAVFAGAFRLKSLVNDIIPELDAIGVPIEILVRGDAADYALEAKNVRLISGGLSEYISEFLLKWRALAPDIVIHPGGDTKNIDYKTANAVLQSFYLGAVPIVTKETAYRDLSLSHGVVKVDGSPGCWAAAVQMLMKDEVRERHYRSLARSCPEIFSPSQNIATLEGIIRELPPMTPIAREQRLRATRTDLDLRYADALIKLDSNRAANHMIALDHERALKEAVARTWQEAAASGWHEGVAAGLAHALNRTTPDSPKPTRPTSRLVAFVRALSSSEPKRPNGADSR